LVGVVWAERPEGALRYKGTEAPWEVNGGERTGTVFGDKIDLGNQKQSAKEKEPKKNGLPK